MQVQCEVYEQKNFDLTEENKTLNQKYSDAEIKLNKFEKDNLRISKEVIIITRQQNESYFVVLYINI